MHRVFVDNESSVNTLYYDTYKKMGIPWRDMIVQNIYSYEFGGEAIKAKGNFRLPLTLVEFPVLLLKLWNSCRLNRSWRIMHLLGAFAMDMRMVTSIYHLSIIFPTPERVGCVRGC